MKVKSIGMLLMFLGLTVVFSSCQKNKTGDLTVNVVDGLGNSIGAGKTVYIYFGNANYTNGTTYKTASTNSSGQTTFFDLEPGDYYADCDWENQLGLTMTSSGNGSVSAKDITTITIAP